ncbi:DUF1801 domain-containing protein [Vibrio nigripulchritudo]|uniref:DUF1801 domain-containing protein n=1 Tax=Vibrio nigripulchritudo TaxID=28173 RepID=UPI002492C841|nr:DUF1801 domain-containing protein [Vibrio nigripulchritudo]BDU36239.1 hypothetical protein TUMSATVNIG2_07080 [Vibrio nigripulchritudo]BDU41896.1 hypothetical protein TUMSATVNIG3_06940 [Vibrio nigripulchritudo]
MSEIKTRPNRKSVTKFLNAVKHDKRREDAFELLAMFERVTERKAVMWGDSIVGFGSYKYTNTKGTYSWMITGFSPRKKNLTVYIMQGFSDYADDLAAIGKVKTAKSCLYLTNLSKINMEALESLLVKAVRDMEEKYDCR